MTDNVRLDPHVQYAKNDELLADWKDAEDVHTWYIYDVDEDKYYDTETGVTAPHKRVPGVCVAFHIGKKEVSMTIPWKNLVHAMSDIIKEDERWREEQKLWSTYKTSSDSTSTPE